MATFDQKLLEEFNKYMMENEESLSEISEDIFDFNYEA